MNEVKKYIKERNGLPYLVAGTVKLLEELLNKESVVFEFGSGVSTIWLAERSKVVYTVEHNAGWTEGLHKYCLVNSIKNVLFHLIPVGWGDNEPSLYEETISNYQDAMFDFILVDGKVSRELCLRNSLSKLKPGGWIGMDDSNKHLITGFDDWKRIEELKSWKFRHIEEGFHFMCWQKPIT